MLIRELHNVVCSTISLKQIGHDYNLEYDAIGYRFTQWLSSITKNQASTCI